METKEYGKFKFLKTNRTLKESNVKKIQESIQEWGYIPGRPILVDEDFNIVDGQHRFEALKNLDLSIHYEVIKGNVIAKTMALNSRQSPWQIKDYVKSYSDQNIDCYRRMWKFEEKYKLGMSNTITLCMGSKKSPSNSIRKGILFLFEEQSDEIADYLMSVEKLPFYKTDKFVKSIFIAYKKLDEKHMSILRTNILKVPRCASVSDYLIAFENIINYKKRGSSLVKL